MASHRPKVLHRLAGRSMLAHVMATGAALRPARQTVVIGAHAPEIGEAVKAADPSAIVAVQDPPRGTADAVGAALPSLNGFEGVVCVLYADTPLIRADTIGRLARACAQGAGVAVLGFRPTDPGAYGRLVLDAHGGLAAIVEAREAGADELEIGFCNSGVMAFRSEVLFDVLPQIGCENAKNEYYLTDAVALARQAGVACAALEADAGEVLGVNSKAELAAAEAAYQERVRVDALAAGVAMPAPETVHFAFDTRIEPDAVVHPYVVFGPGVTVEAGAEIKSFSHLEGARVRAGAVVGPYARLRPGADIGEDARIGNFVEVKQAEIGAGAKVNHLSYVGDAQVGPAANVGAGVITCNYDGVAKHRTHIGAGAFIGSNSALVAPVAVGEGAYVGSGSVITEPVEPGALALTRAPLKTIAGWAAKFRARAKTKQG